MRASKTRIASSYYPSALQLATDGKLYATSNGSSYLSAITFPNNAGLSCTFQDSAVYLNGKQAGIGLPNFISGFDYSNTTFNCNKAGISEISDENITLYPNPSANGWQLIVSSDLIGSLLEVFDVNGVSVFKYEIQSIHSIFKLETDPGIYYLHINSPKNSIIKKLVKL